MMTIDKAVKTRFQAEIGRELNMYEENILRNWKRENSAMSTDEQMRILYIYLAERAAVELNILPQVEYATPTVLEFTNYEPRSRWYRPAVYYASGHGNQWLYILGMMPRILANAPRKDQVSKLESGLVVSHGIQLTWETARDDRYSWAHPMGAHWMSMVFDQEAFNGLRMEVEMPKGYFPLRALPIRGRSLVDESWL